MSATLEHMWAGAEVRLRMYPGRARPVTTDDVDMEIDAAAGTAATATATATADSAANPQASETRFDPLRNHRLDRELQINRVPIPGKPEPAPTGREDGGAAAAPALELALARGRGRGRGGRGGRGAGRAAGRAAGRRAQPPPPRYEGDELRRIALVEGLEILGRSDVRDKRLHQPPNGDAHVVEGTLGINSTVAAQMKRSMEYAKRANRPRIICDSVDQFRLAAR